jgi:hypothetical protein
MTLFFCAPVVIKVRQFRTYILLYTKPSQIFIYCLDDQIFNSMCVAAVELNLLINKLPAESSLLTHC